MVHVQGLRCRECGREYDPAPIFTCEWCFGPLEVAYDYDAIKASVTLPQGASFDDFGRNPDAYRGTAQVDIDGFFQEIHDNVLGPVLKTKELLASRPYITRLYSTMSADDMTVDPAFNYNSDLADVSRVHTAQQYIECSADVTEYEAPWRIELSQGGVIRGKDRCGRLRSTRCPPT